MSGSSFGGLVLLMMGPGGILANEEIIVMGLAGREGELQEGRKI